MQTDHVAFVAGCVLVLGCCAESAWIGFRDGLRGLTPAPTWTEEATVIAELKSPSVSDGRLSEDLHGESAPEPALVPGPTGLPEVALLAE